MRGFRDVVLRPSLFAAASALAASATLGQAAAPHLPPLDRSLPPRAEAVYRAIAARVDEDAAMEVVAEIAPLWRLPGNPAFDRALAAIGRRLAAAGISSRDETVAETSAGWEQIEAEIRLDGPEGEVVLSKAQDRVPLAIHSTSTPVEGLLAPLVDVGAGTGPEHYEGREVAGAVVLADGPLLRVWNQAVKARGAAGVVSTQIASYTRPETTPGVLEWGSIPDDEARASFGFKATPRAAARLRQRLAEADVRVHVRVETKFHRRPVRSLVAEIPGASRPDERIVLVAHVQEPGANDNASGCGSLLAAALAIRKAVDEGALPPPARTLTFLWGDEIRVSRAWMAADAKRLPSVLAMMSLDMTGEDTSVTGGTFLIEKEPDPSAVWDRPSDPHSEWGAGSFDRGRMRGSFLNDLHLAVALRRARDTGWVVRTNPYEGGSDHTAFFEAGVPALLNWHFTDRYYHTNLDTLDKVSPSELGNVAAAVATTSAFLASAGSSDVEPLESLLAAAREARFETERANSATEEILEAWRVWYDEALESVERLREPR